MKRVMVIDDEKNICQSLAFALEDDYQTYTFMDPEEALLVLEQTRIDVVLLDLRLGSHDGIDILKEIKRISPRTVVIIMTAYGSMASSLDALKEGAFYYVTKPVQIDELHLLLQKALEFHGLQGQVEWLHEELHKGFGKVGIIGKSQKMTEIFELIERIKDVDSHVMITGESGTGKEVVARAIHMQGNRSKDRFVAINCAAIPTSLLESELFGYEKGAFTGANQRKPGWFELADGGTIFLDEVGEMEPLLQSKLLRVIQEKRFTPVGATMEISSNIRIITATNRDLRKEVSEKRFREDLYFRLKVIPLALPSLKERKEDIPLLVHHFLQSIGERVGRSQIGISHEALELLVRYDYPGNVRELQNIMERAIVLARGPRIQVEDLSFEAGMASSTPPMERRLIPVYVGETLEEVEKKLILANLHAMGGNRRKAAVSLAMGERTLREKIKKYQLEV